MNPWRFHTTASGVAELLRGGGEFNEASRILSDLTAEQATAPIANSPYTIATLVWHLHYWQQRSLAKVGLLQTGPERVAHIEDSFPVVSAEDWDTLCAAFLAGIEQGREMTPEIGNSNSRDNEETSAGYDMAESALHNAYHLGQIVLLRRMAGFWPPSDGDVNDW